MKLATCATTEVGFIRVASGPARLAASVAEARSDLDRLKLRERMMFIGDRVLGRQMPGWVTKPDQTTDGHLLMLAKANGVQFVTLDRGIRGAVLIPNPPEIGAEPQMLANHCRCGA